MVKKRHIWRAWVAVQNIFKGLLGGALLEQTPSQFELHNFAGHFPKMHDETNIGIPLLSCIIYQHLQISSARFSSTNRFPISRFFLHFQILIEALPVSLHAPNSTICIIGGVDLCGSSFMAPPHCSSNERTLHNQNDIKTSINLCFCSTKSKTKTFQWASYNQR